VSPGGGRAEAARREMNKESKAKYLVLLAPAPGAEGAL
jgi:hypothetical protein